MSRIFLFGLHVTFWVSFFFPVHLFADFCLGQSDLVVEIRRCGSDKKKEKAHDQQSHAEAQT